MKKHMNSKGLPNMKPRKSIFWFNIHGNGYQAAYYGDIGYNGSGFSGVGITHFNVLWSLLMIP